MTCPHIVTTDEGTSYCQLAEAAARPELVGLTEIAARCGVSTPAVCQWRARRPDFPEPVARLAMGSVWTWQAVEPWLTAHRKLSRTKGGEV